MPTQEDFSASKVRSHVGPRESESFRKPPQSTFPETAPTEEWRPVVGFEGWYEVSNLGRVKRIKKLAGGYSGRILKHTPDSWGYMTVRPSAEGEQKTTAVHALVARAFLGETPDGFEINHKDGHKPNCALSNLEFVTHPENMRHSYAHGLHPRLWGRNKRTYKGKPTEWARLLADEARDAAAAEGPVSP